MKSESRALHSGAASGTAAVTVDRSIDRAWLVATTLLWIYGLVWWLELRPGMFTEDSGMYLAQAVTGNVSNQKPFFYTRFLQLITLGGKFAVYAALIQAFIALTVIGRLFALAWVHRAPAWLIGACALLVANPYFMGMVFYVQNDPLFCIAMVAVIVEALHCRLAGAVTPTSMVMVALLLPMALLFRQNGLLFVPLWAIGLPFLLGRDAALRLGGAGLLACALASASIIGVRTSDTLDVRYPAVVHAVSGLARAEYGREAGANLADETRTLVGPRRLRLASEFYSPRHWDFAGFFPRGPQFHSLDEARKDEIVSSFVRNDLWSNLPTVAAIRVEMLLSILMGRGPPVEIDHIPNSAPSAVAETILANSVQPGALTPAMMYSIRQPWTRASFLSLLLLLCVTVVAIWRHDGPTLWASGLLLLQLAAIAAVAPSADARYVLYIYLSPFVAMLAVCAWRLAARSPASDVTAAGHP